MTIPLTKSYEDAEGNLFVEGLATSDDLDLDEQIIDRDFARKQLSKWFEDWGNVRQMHSANLAPAGKAVEFQEVPGGFWVKTQVVEPTARELVKSGVYTAYSVGIAKPRIVRDTVAKNGRVVDGIFSEISLVDFPANPACRLSLAKRAGGAVEIVEKDMTADLVKRDIPEKHREEMDESDFAGPHRSFPIEKPEDVSAAAHLVGKAENPDAVKERIIAIAHRKGASFVAELPDSWKSAKPFPGAAPPFKKKDDEDDEDGKDDEKSEKARREYKDGEKKPFAGAAKPFSKDDDEDKGDDGDEDDKSEKRDAKRGLADHREPDGDEDGPDEDGDGDGKMKSTVPMFIKRLHAGLCPAFQEADVLVEFPAVAAGVPSITSADWFYGQLTEAAAKSRLSDLPSLGSAYGAALAVAGMDPLLVDDVVEETRKAFSEFFPDAHPTPNDVHPAEFDRSFLDTGRYRQRPGTPPRIPLAAHTPDPHSLDRGPLTDGRERNLGKGRTYYSNAAKDQAGSSLAALHDYIVSHHPEVCPVHGPAVEIKPGIGDVLYQHNGSSLTVGVPSTESLPNRAVNQPTPADPAASVRAGLEPELVKSLVAEAIREATAPLTEQIGELRKRVETYEAQPDPAAAATRHATAAVVVQKAQTHNSVGEPEVDRGQVDALVSLIKRARHKDSRVSQPACDQLIKQFGPSAAAELIS